MEREAAATAEEKVAAPATVTRETEHELRAEEIVNSIYERFTEHQLHGWALELRQVRDWELLQAIFALCHRKFGNGWVTAVRDRMDQL